MFINLHELPPGKHMFTLALTSQPRDTPRDAIEYDEIDVVADHGANVFTVVGSMKPEDREAYLGCRVIGCIDQSSAYVIFEDPASSIMVVR